MRPLVVPAVIALALCAGVLRADPAAEARRAIQNAYDVSSAAAGRKDTAGTLAHFTPDAVILDTKSHSTPMTQERQTVTRLFAAAQSVTARTTILKFALESPTQATTTVHEHHTLTLVDPRTHQPAQLVVDDTARDLWVKTAQGWRQKRSQDLTYSSTLNGQTLPSP